MCDFMFRVSVFDLIDNENFEILCMLLEINLTSEWLEREYDNIKRGQGDVYLFQSNTGSLILNLFQDPTDQNEMVLVGIRCKKEIYSNIKAILEIIYTNAPVKSTQFEEGTDILDELIVPQNYPIRQNTITIIDGKEVFYFFQNLKIFYYD